MSQFVIRFQSLQFQIAKKNLDAELKDIFLEAIQEPLRTTLAVFDFSDQTIDKVIDKALVMDRTHKSNATINMTTLTNNLPSLQELRFRQAVQRCRVIIRLRGEKMGDHRGLEPKSR